MRADVHRDLTASSRAFVETVWPVIADGIGGGRVVMVEGATDDTLKHDLDTLAGIDAWQMMDGIGVMRGIASRVQWVTNRRPYNTFTIRVGRPSGARTERDKRIEAIENIERGFLLPHLTIQAYLDKGTDELLSVGVVKTVDLFTCVRDQPSYYLNRAGNGGEVFEIYAFHYLIRLGYKVAVWHLQESRAA